MTRRDAGPRRSPSVEALLRGTRILAIAALLALAAGIVSDVFEGDFWARHALLASLAASVIVVMISVAVIDAVLERRRRERWSILAQFVMLELVRNARLIWTGVLAQVGLLSVDAARPESVDANGRIVRDTPLLTAAVRHTIADEALRRELHEEIALLAAHTDEVLGRWAAVMLNADVYAEVIDRHVELASDISWLVSLLDNAEPPQDYRRQRRASSSPAVQVEGQIAGEDLAARIVVITQLAEELDRNTLDLALRIVPVEWWQTRLGATVPLDGGVANG
jgi:8-oxo-dGTP pyrophosphatase MutT (NUDIX family)